MVPYDMNARMKSAVVQARESASLSSEEAAISIDIEDCTNNKSFFVNLVTQYRLFTVYVSAHYFILFEFLLIERY